MHHLEKCSRLQAARTWLHIDFREVSQAKNRKEKWSKGWLTLILKRNACRVLGLRQGSAKEETAAGTACVEGSVPWA